MKLFNGDIATLPERTLDDKRGLAFDENILFMPEDGPGQKLAQAGIRYDKTYFDAVKAGIGKAKASGKPRPEENKGGKPATEIKSAPPPVPPPPSPTTPSPAEVR